MDEKIISGSLDTAEYAGASPQFLQDLPNSILGLENGRPSNELAETVFRAYWQGFQHAADNTHATWKPQATKKDLEQQNGSLNDSEIVSLLESWYKVGRTSGSLIKDGENRAS